MVTCFPTMYMYVTLATNFPLDDQMMTSRNMHGKNRVKRETARSKLILLTCQLVWDRRQGDVYSVYFTFCQHWLTGMGQMERRDVLSLVYFKFKVPLAHWFGTDWKGKYILSFISSPEPKAHRWAYRIPMDPASVVVRPSVHIFKHLLLRNRLANQSQTLCGASLGRGDKSLYKWPGHMTKMAATPIYGKNFKKSSSPEPAGRFPRNLVCIIGDSCPS